MPTASHCARANHPQGPNQRLDVEILLRSHASATQGDAGLPLRSVPDRRSQNQAILEQASSDSAYGVSPFHGPNRKSNAGLGTSPRNTTGQGPPTRQASSTTRTKPRNSNDSHRSSLPRTTRIWQAPGLNREPAADIRFSPTAPPNTDQSPTPHQPETPEPSQSPTYPIPTSDQDRHTARTKPEIGHQTPNQSTERSWDEISAQDNQLTGNIKEFQRSSHQAADNHHRQSFRHPHPADQTGNQSPNSESVHETPPDKGHRLDRHHQSHHKTAEPSQSPTLLNRAKPKHNQLRGPNRK